MRRQLAYGLPFGFSALLYIVLTDLHNYFRLIQIRTRAFCALLNRLFQSAIRGNHWRIGGAGFDFPR
jgi:hypothetical protein